MREKSIYVKTIGEFPRFGLAVAILTGGLKTLLLKTSHIRVLHSNTFYVNSVATLGLIPPGNARDVDVEWDGFESCYKRLFTNAFVAWFCLKTRELAIVIRWSSVAGRLILLRDFLVPACLH